MKISPAIEEQIASERVKLRVGYPWWLRVWLARDVVAITLGRRVYIAETIGKRSADYVERLLRHELAHVRQVNRLGLLRFLWRYSMEFLRHFRREGNVARAYRLISFEVEAYAAEEGADV